MKLGMIGLGRMGGNMAERLRRGSHDVVGYARSGDQSQVGSLAELVEALPAPRVAWAMVPAGEPTETTVATLGDLMGPGDVVVDGANSHYRDSIRRGESLTDRGIGFLDAGVSGGIWGLAEGYCLMVGGELQHVEMVRPAFETLAPPDGFAHVGGPGAGHFTKMVHNAVEYGLMQAYGEGYELLAASDLGVDPAGAMRLWRHGSVVRSWLLDLLVRALDDDPRLASTRGWAEDSGEGRWAVHDAVDRAVPLPVISAALYARFASRQDDSLAMKVVAALRHQFGGHGVRSREE